MSDTSLSFDFLRGRDTATPHMARVAAAAQAMDRTVRASNDETVRSHQRVGREVFKIDNVFRNTARRMASHALLIGGAIIAAAGHAVAFTYAIWPMVGALAAIPAVAVGAAIGLGSLLAVFSGLGAAMRRSAGGGAAETDALTAATRRYELAQRSAADAQRDLNDARAEAARRLADVSRELARARLDEEGAVLAVAEAQRRLREARSSGDRLERAEADLALRQSILSLEDVRLRVSDLKAEEQERTEKGVEGSDEVQQALRRQADAAYELAQAQQALARSQTGAGGVDAAAQAYARLSDAGREVVDMLRSQGPAWRSLQQAIQQAALVGVAADIGLVSGMLLAQQPHLVAIGSAWNTAFHGIAAALTSAQGVADLNTTLGNTAVMAQHLGAAWQPFVAGFLTFVAAGSEFLPRLGVWVERLANDFSTWATEAARAGRIQTWIENAITAAKLFGAIIRDVSMAIGSIFRAGSGGPNYLANLAEDAAKFREAMASPEEQARLAAFFTSARELGSALWDVIKSLLDVITKSPDVIGSITGAVTIVGIVLGFAADHAELLNAILPPIITAFLAYKTATLAIQIATNLWTAAQWLLNAALTANPIGLVIVIIGLLIAAIVLLVQNWDTVKRVVGVAWDFIMAKVEDAVHFVHRKIEEFLAPILAIGRRIQEVGIWNSLVGGFKVAINTLIGLWNRLDFSIGPWTVPSWVPGIGGNGFYIPDVFPDIPFLDTGGDILKTGLAVVHEGERVNTAAEVRRGDADGGKQVVELRLTGADREFLRFLRKVFKDNNILVPGI